jgi:uncharacterized membrane protein
MEPKDKVLALVSYLTIVRWVVVFVLHVSGPHKSRLVKFHLRQSLGLLISALIVWSVLIILGIGLLHVIFQITFIVYWVLGMFYAFQGEMKYLPYVGGYFDDFFKFIE